ncbi:Nucleoside triphosphate pyrophosphohydrolase [Polystyrenella longa]|uniref:Nucleoside triphosphate pyrophosphohydrolase n=1 Tax=Polystyrenella longa TaxID=2528007 RepID=A0A518CGZ7_9PLAN|nr:nucleoside triphosphate pyrophosphohydrolase [Polystyrenella longa]QDU78506.1 Nucleoside triphosphate pyrophosphohydrolase [Polystyrenella longa]
MSTSVPESFASKGVPPEEARVKELFWKLCQVIAKLRSPEGCPWDREQTLETIKPYTLEETHELLEAIDSGNDEHITEELGDVLLQVMLDSQIGADENRFDICQVIKTITEKMIRRHPHVFGEVKVESAGDVRQHWEKAKATEKKRDSIFDGLPKALPQLARAARLSTKAARVGYDFPDRLMLFDKLREEMDELQEELFPNGPPPPVTAGVDSAPVSDEPILDEARRDRVEQELGDVLFVLANIARRWKINPEEALRKSNQKFEKRVQYIERQLANEGRTIADATLQDMERLYQQGKQEERRQPPTSNE